MNMSKFDLILVPVCHSQHWTLLVLDFSKRIIVELNSVFSTSLEIVQIYYRFLMTLEKTLNCQSRSKWSVYKPVDLPKQTNGYDCGVFTCLFADIICQGRGSVSLRGLK